MTSGFIFEALSLYSFINEFFSYLPYPIVTAYLSHSN